MEDGRCLAFGLARRPGARHCAAHEYGASHVCTSGHVRFRQWEPRHVHISRFPQRSLALSRSDAMKTTLRLAVFAFAGFSSAAFSVSLRPDVDVDLVARTVDADQPRGTCTSALADSGIHDPDRVQTAIQRGLESRGMKRVPTDGDVAIRVDYAMGPPTIVREIVA